jgi:hypothetical protein
MPLISTLANSSARGFGFNLSVSNSEDENATGVSATAGVGSVTAVGGNNVVLTGVLAAVSAGTAQVQITNSNASVSLSGVSASASSGSASVVVPPAAQYFLGYYWYLSSTNTYAHNVVNYKWDGSAVTLVGGTTSTGYLTYNTNPSVNNNTKMAANKSVNSGDTYMVYVLALGYNFSNGSMPIQQIGFSAETGAISSSIVTIDTVSGAGTNRRPIAISVGHNDSRLAVIYTNGIRVYSQNNSVGVTSTISQITPLTPPPSAVSFGGIDVHPTADYIVFSDVTNSVLHAYKNWGSSSAPVESSATYAFSAIGLTATVRQVKWSYSGNYLAIAADQQVVVIEYDPLTGDLDASSAQSVSLSTDFDFTKLEWGPQDSYLLVVGDPSTSNAMLTVQGIGGTLSVNPYQYPNSYQNGIPALNYDGSYLFGLCANAPSDINVRVFSMGSGNTGLPSSLVWTSGSLGNTNTRDFLQTISLPPVQS